MPDEQARPETMPAENVVWHQCKMLRDANRKSADAADMIMQAIEVAPELDVSMQFAFGIKSANQPVKTPINPGGMTADPRK